MAAINIKKIWKKVEPFYLVLLWEKTHLSPPFKQKQKCSKESLIGTDITIRGFRHCLLKFFDALKRPNDLPKLPL